MTWYMTVKVMEMNEIDTDLILSMRYWHINFSKSPPIKLKSGWSTQIKLILLWNIWYSYKKHYNHNMNNQRFWDKKQSYTVNTKGTRSSIKWDIDHNFPNAGKATAEQMLWGQRVEISWKQQEREQESLECE